MPWSSVKESPWVVIPPPPGASQRATKPPVSRQGSTWNVISVHACKLTYHSDNTTPVRTADPAAGLDFDEFGGFIAAIGLGDGTARMETAAAGHGVERGHISRNGTKTFVRSRRVLGPTRSGLGCKDAKDVSTGRARGLISTICPAYMTATRSAISPTMPRLWVMSSRLMPRRCFKSLEQIENLRLNGDIQRGGRLVGHEKFGLGGQGHGNEDALLHAAGHFVRDSFSGAIPARGCRRI